MSWGTSLRQPASPGDGSIDGAESNEDSIAQAVDFAGCRTRHGTSSADAVVLVEATTQMLGDQMNQRFIRPLLCQCKAMTKSLKRSSQ